MNNLTFYCNETSIEKFWKWLKDYSIKVWARQEIITVDDGHYSVDRARKHGTHDQTYFTISTSKIKPTNIPGQDRLAYKFEIAEFTPILLGKRLKIDVSYTDAFSFFPYFFKLFNNITDDWPETRPIISKHLNDIASRYGMELEIQNNDNNIQRASLQKQQQVKKKERRPAKVRAALAIAKMKKDTINQTSAATWACTTSGNINKYMDDPYVKEQAKYFIEHPVEMKDARDNFARKSLRRRKKIN